MPLDRKEPIHGWVCSFYSNGTVMVGTTADRFPIKVPADESSWVATRRYAPSSLSIIARELATAEELPIDEAGVSHSASLARAQRV